MNPRDPEDLRWESLVERIETGDITVIALTSQALLVQEGNIMKHSAGSYAPACLAGASRIFSLRRRGRRTATMEIIRSAGPDGEGPWTVAQVSGPRNQAPPEPERAAAREMTRLYNEAWQSRLE